MIFMKNKANPPLNKNQPPVAGAIYWERSLFHNIKITIIRFLEVPEMLESEQGKLVSTQQERGGQEGRSTQIGRASCRERV